MSDEAAHERRLRILSLFIIRKIQRETPSLCSDGFCDFRFRKSVQMIRDDFAQERTKMTSEACVIEFLHAMDFLRGRAERKGFSEISSYGFKHTAERWHEWQSGERVFISNGMFIAAAIASGFKIKRISGSRNCLVNISSRGLTGIWRRVGNSILPVDPSIICFM